MGFAIQVGQFIWRGLPLAAVILVPATATFGAGEPQLVLTTIKSAYASGEAPTLLLMLTLPPNAPKSWTVTGFAPGALKVASLTRSAIPGRGVPNKSGPVNPRVSNLSPNTAALLEAHRAAEVLHPGTSLGIPIQMSRDPESGTYRLLIVSVQVTKGPIKRERLAAYYLPRGRYTLSLSYEPQLQPLNTTAMTTPKVVSNSVIFQID